MSEPTTRPDGLDARLERAPPQDDLEARHWRDAVSQKLFGRTRERVSIGRFKILARIGSGGAGVVYSAWDPSLERRVAVKLLHADHDPTQVQREAKLLAKLNHPHVVSVYEVGECEGAPFLAMEFVDGQTLAEHMAQQHPWRALLPLFEQVAAGLQAAHEQGIVHGDVKPSNVLIGKDGRVRVSDFGIAHAGGEVLGATPAYMAPEQAAGLPATAASDQFSLCVTLYEALHGSRPFQASTPKALRERLLKGERAPLSEASVPAWLSATIDRGLQLDPKARHPSLQALELAWRRGTTRRRRVLIKAGFAASLLAGGFAATLRGDLDHEDDACTQAQAELSTLWSQTTRERLADRFARQDQQFAAQSWSRVEAELDAYAQALDEANTLACSDTDLEITLRRQLCVRRRLTELDALINVLDTSDSAVLQRSVSALSTLTDPSICRAVHLPAVGPDDATLEGIHADVARARALRGVGKLDDARALLRETVRTARDLQDPHATAVVLLEYGDVLQVSQGITRDGATEPTLESAYLAALASDDQQLAARALLSLANANYRAARFEDALRWLDRLDQRATALEDERLQKRAAVLRAMVSSMQDVRVGGSKTRVALAALRETGVRDVWVAQGLNNIGEWDFDAGRYGDARELYEQSLEISMEVLGPWHPQVAGTLGNLAEVEMMEDDLDAAREHFARALEIRASVEGKRSYWSMHTLAHLADVDRRAGRLGAAKEAYGSVLAFVLNPPAIRETETFFAIDSGVDQLEPWARNGLALIALERGAPDRALALAREISPKTQIRAERHTDLAARFDVLALAQAQTGDLDAALRTLDRFEQPVEQAFGPRSYKAAYPALARAHVLLGHDDEAACAAAARARTVFDADRGSPPADLAALRQIEQQCAPSPLD